MDTPICDFVRAYSQRNALRVHMPGHKGRAVLGVETMDITEVDGADSLYEASGIIRRSEENASGIFGCPTYYSTEGSSQCIRAMVHMALVHGRTQSRKPLIAACRNAHKSFLSAAALCDAEILWIYPKEDEGYLSCTVSPERLEAILSRAEDKPCALYITSPDYLGKMADVAGLSRICRKYGMLLLVDCAHGAYLRFLPESAHPMDLGADMCCASAHKTLPVLTGGAYLHLSPEMANLFGAQVRNAMALFGSTSPSYLILQSLDAANPRLEKWGESLREFVPKLKAMKERLREKGYILYGDEELKLCICAKAFGYYGRELSGLLDGMGIVCEFADADYVVMMLSPEMGDESLARLEAALVSVKPKSKIAEPAPCLHRAEAAMGIREAAMSPCETVSIEEASGRVLSAATVGCPPAVPILVCGERIDSQAIECFRYYGVEMLSVIK